MNVTINTDASYSNIHKLGAFAFWIACDQGRIKRTGPLKDVTSAQDAELKCIGNALAALYGSHFKPITGILIYSDAKYALQKINATALPDTPERYCYDMLVKFRQKASRTGLKLRRGGFWELKHVKAHTGAVVLSKRQFVNEWCDKNARQVMRQMVKQKK